MNLNPKTRHKLCKSVNKKSNTSAIFISQLCRNTAATFTLRPTSATSRINLTELNHEQSDDSVKALTQTYCGKIGAAIKIKKCKTETETLWFCSELEKQGLQRVFCWPWQNAIGWLVKTLFKILSSADLSYTKILTLHIITLYITEKRGLRTIWKFH